MNKPELTEGQHRFFALLDQVKQLRPYWDLADRSCQVDQLTDDIDRWSPAEQQLARFFVMIWFGQNRMNFDLAEAASSLDEPSRRLIARWMEEPFWP